MAFQPPQIMPDPAPSRSSGPSPASDAAPVDQGILIEMNDNNDICINATHLTVKCDNSFLVQGGSTGAKVSGKAKGSSVAGKSSVIVVQQPAEDSIRRSRMPSASTNFCQCMCAVPMFQSACVSKSEFLAPCRDMCQERCSGGIDPDDHQTSWSNCVLALGTQSHRTSTHNVLCILALSPPFPSQPQDQARSNDPHCPGHSARIEPPSFNS